MAYNELLQSMELGAQEKIKEIIGAARMAADDIFRDAKRESEEVKRQLQAEAADVVSVERNRSLYLLREELKAEEIREKERIYLEAFEKAGEELKSYRKIPDTVRALPAYSGNHWMEFRQRILRYTLIPAMPNSVSRPSRHRNQSFSSLPTCIQLEDILSVSLMEASRSTTRSNQGFFRQGKF